MASPWSYYSWSHAFDRKKKNNEKPSRPAAKPAAKAPPANKQESEDDEEHGSKQSEVGGEEEKDDDDDDDGDDSEVANPMDLSYLTQDKAPRNVTDKYLPLPTKPIIDHCYEYGWYVAEQKMQTRGSRVPREFAAHLVTLVHHDHDHFELSGREFRPTLVIFNSTDGDRALKLVLGVHRFISNNGLIIGANSSADAITSIRFMHVGSRTNEDERKQKADYVRKKCAAFCDKILRDHYPVIKSKIKAWKRYFFPSKHSLDKYLDICWDVTKKKTGTEKEKEFRNEMTRTCSRRLSLWEALNAVQSYLCNPMHFLQSSSKQQAALFYTNRVLWNVTDSVGLNHIDILYRYTVGALGFTPHMVSSTLINLQHPVSNRQLLQGLFPKKLTCYSISLHGGMESRDATVTDTTAAQTHDAKVTKCFVCRRIVGDEVRCFRCKYVECSCVCCPECRDPNFAEDLDSKVISTDACWQGTGFVYEGVGGDTIAEDVRQTQKEVGEEEEDERETQEEVGEELCGAEDEDYGGATTWSSSKSSPSFEELEDEMEAQEEVDEELRGGEEDEDYGGTTMCSSPVTIPQRSSKSSSSYRPRQIADSATPHHDLGEFLLSAGLDEACRHNIYNKFGYSDLTPLKRFLDFYRQACNKHAKSDSPIECFANDWGIKVNSVQALQEAVEEYDVLRK